jgi:hypothetical protein
MKGRHEKTKYEEPERDCDVTCRAEELRDLLLANPLRHGVRFA